MPADRTKATKQHQPLSGHPRRLLQRTSTQPEERDGSCGNPVAALDSSHQLPYSTIFDDIDEVIRHRPSSQEWPARILGLDQVGRQFVTNAIHQVSWGTVEYCIISRLSIFACSYI